MHFGFQLDPLERIEPWGEGDDRTLHWFGLTSGTYWIDVGQQRLFESFGFGGGPPECLDYQVARLYEDVLAIVPRVLEAVPEDLVALAGLARHASALRIDAVHRIWERATAEASDDDIESALSWRNERVLDVLYLSAGPQIVLWSDETHVHLAWDNRSIRHEGRPIWTAESGVQSMTRGDFVEAVRDFHARLMEAMSNRVDAIVAGALSHVRIDVPGLVREQRQRARLSESELVPSSESTDWDRVRAAIGKLDGIASEDEA